MRDKTYTDKMGVTFSEDRKTLVEVPGDMEEYVVPEGTESIASFAFRMTTLLRKSPLRKVVLPETLKSISSYAFFMCSNLQEINFPDSLEEIGFEAFDWCTGLNEIVLPKNLKTMQGNPFSFCEVNISSLSPNFTVENGCLYGDNGKKLIRIATNEQHFSIREGVEVIAHNALDKDLEELVLPASLKRIDGSSYCNSVKRLIWKGKPAESLVSEVSKTYEGI